MTDNRKSYEAMSQFVLEDLGDKIKIKGIMLAPGFWKKTLYVPEEIQKLFEEHKKALMQMPLTIEHERTKKYLGRSVGKHTSIKWDPKINSILYEAIIDDPEAVKDVKAGKFGGTSLRNWLNFDINAQGLMTATDLHPIHNTLTVKPACKDCTITGIEPLSLGDGTLIFYGVYPTEDVIESLSKDCASCDNKDGECNTNESDELSELRIEFNLLKKRLKTLEGLEDLNNMESEEEEQVNEDLSEEETTETTETTEETEATETETEETAEEVAEETTQTVTVRDIPLNIILDITPRIKETIIVPSAVTEAVEAVVEAEEETTETTEETEETEETESTEESTEEESTETETTETETVDNEPWTPDEIVQAVKKAGNPLDVIAEILIKREQRAERW